MFSLKSKILTENEIIGIINKKAISPIVYPVSHDQWIMFVATNEPNII